MPTTLRLLLLLMLGLFGLEPVSYAYDAPVPFVSGAQNIAAASPETQAATAETAAPVPLNFNRAGGALGTLATIRTFSDFVAAESAGQIGYHATNPANVESILANGLNESSAGRLGGGGVYVNNTPEGALAEYMAHNPGGPAPSILPVQYEPGLNYQISLPTQPTTVGPLPLGADSLTAPSVRLPGTFNTIIRNGSAVPVAP